MDRGSKKRKRKKSILSQARKCSQKGFYGRGTHVDEDVYKYFLRIYEMDIDKLEEEEKVIFVSNALKETEGQEVHLSSNQFISRVIEKLLTFSTEEHLLKYISAFIDLRILCTHNFASHVLQTLIKVCAVRFRKEGNTALCEFVKRTSQFIFNNLDEFLDNPYANKIGRTCLEECSGIGNQEPLSFEIVDAVGTRILKWPNLDCVIKSDLLSGFVQVLLVSLSKTNPKIAQKLVKKLLEECFIRNDDSDDVKLKDPKIEEFFQSMASTRLLESMIEVSTGKRYTQIFAQIFLNRLKLLSCNNQSYISVQKLISCCQETSEFQLIITELMPHISDILEAGHVGVVVELAKACIRLKSSEGEFLKGLKGALKADNSSCGELVTKILFLSGEKVNKNGSLLLQALFEFKKPISVVENLLSVDTKVLKEIFLDPKGSYVADAFVSSKTIGEKSRDRLLQKMKGHYKDLVIDKHGSRVVEAFWSRASLKDRHLIMAELDRSISRTVPGSIMASKFRLDLYLSDKTKWANSETKSPTQIFANLVQ